MFERFILRFSFITWKDLRADGIVKQWNSSLMLKAFRVGSYILHKILGEERFLLMSAFKFMNTQVLVSFEFSQNYVPSLHLDIILFIIV